MKACYKKLWKLLIDKNMNKTDLRTAAGITTTALAKLGRDENVNTEILAKICKVLECGVDDVMEFIVTREDSKVWGSAKIDFIRDKQIPLLQKTGLTRTLAREWFWLGYYSQENGDRDAMFDCYRKVLAVLTMLEIKGVVVRLPGKRVKMK